jgi:TolA-binding protein
MTEGKRRFNRVVLLAAAAALAFWPVRGGAQAVHESAATSTDPRIADLDAKIKALREQYKAQLDPLQAQVKELQTKYEMQITALEDQRREIVESGESADMRALEEQEVAEMKSIGDQEKAEIEKVHSARRDAQGCLAPSTERRKELHPPSSSTAPRYEPGSRSATRVPRSRSA